jgi:hypothetical protein
MKKKDPRAKRTAPRQADPNAAPFSSFLERDKARQKREQSRRRTILISIGVHVLAVVAVLLYSFYDVDELYGPTVGVKVMRAKDLPPGVTSREISVPAPDPALVPPPSR